MTTFRKYVMKKHILFNYVMGMELGKGLDKGMKPARTCAPDTAANWSGNIGMRFSRKITS